MKPDAPNPPQPPFVIALAVVEHTDGWRVPRATESAGFAWHGPNEEEPPDTERISEREPADPASSKAEREVKSSPRRRLELVFE